jgi:hypothetical protein
VHSDFELNLGGFVLRIPFDVWYFSHLNSSCVQSNGDMGEVLVGDVLFRRYVVLFDLTMPHKVALGFGLRNRSYTLGTSHAVVTKHAVAKVSTDGQGFPSNYPGPPLATDIVSIQNKHNTQYALLLSHLHFFHLHHYHHHQFSIPLMFSINNYRNMQPGISSTYRSDRRRSPSE